MIQVGIIGGAGYTAGELLRVLLYHPKVALKFVHSQSQAGRPIAQVHPDLLGETALHFSQEVDPSIDVLFLCAGHGHSKTFLEKYQFSDDTLIIDLSRDFRMTSSEHDFIYGLPELNFEQLQQSKRIANCGCFATAIQLALLPLAAAGQLKAPIHIQAITGSTGAGQKAQATTHFSWRNNNVSVYKTFRHQHLAEIRQSLQQLQADFEQAIYFVPMRGDFARGIFTNLYTPCDWTTEEAYARYEAYYANAPFVHLSRENPHLKQIVNTNKCLIYLEQIDGQLFIVSILDNLLKGASGQAVQNMNIAFGWPQQLGLQLKAAVF
ncbi:MAG: N-acetyl-gamma-glutamyl-phosphate reductase [Bacteroidota bacterium]